MCPRCRLAESRKELLLLVLRHTTTRIFDFDPQVGFSAVAPPWFIQYICSQCFVRLESDLFPDSWWTSPGTSEFNCNVPDRLALGEFDSIGPSKSQ
jgi:hypothetical protein